MRLYFATTLVVVLVVFVAFSQGSLPISSSGTQFVFGLAGQVYYKITLQIVTFQQDPPVNVDVTVPSLGISLSFTVSRSAVHVVDWKDRDDLYFVAIIVQADGDISVVPQFDNKFILTDNFLALPTPSLGTRYHYVSYPPLCTTGFLLIVSLGDGETDIELSNFRGNSKPKPPFDGTIRETLAPYSTYLMHGKGWIDWTGVLITADKPIAVISTLYCASVTNHGNKYGPGGCEYITEIIPDIESYGRYFVLSTYYPRTSGFVYRVVASQNGTNFNVTFSDQTVESHYMDAGDFYEGDIMVTHEILLIVSSKPILIMQYTKSRNPSQGPADNIADSLMTLVPSIEHYTGDLVFAADAFGLSYYLVTIISFCCDQSGIVVDGILLTDWTKVAELANGDMCATQLKFPKLVGPKSHLIEHPDGAKFLAIVHGRGTKNAYGHPAKYNVHLNEDLLTLSEAPSIKSVGNDSVEIEWQSWGSSVSDSGDGPVAEYRVFYRDTSSVDDWRMAGVVSIDLPCGLSRTATSYVEMTTYEYTVSPLAPASYEFSVSAVGRWEMVGPKSPTSPAVEILLPTTTIPTTSPLPPTTTIPTTTIPTTTIPTTTIPTTSPPISTTYDSMTYLPTTTVEVSTTSPPSSNIELDGSLGIDRSFTDQLQDSQSDEYQQLENEFIEAMDTALQEKYGQNYRVVVFGFSSGSVVVNYRIIFTNVTLEENKNEKALNETREAFLNVLQDVVSDGELGEFEVIPESIQVSSVHFYGTTHVPHTEISTTSSKATLPMTTTLTAPTEKVRSAKLTTSGENALISTGSVSLFIIFVITCCIVYKRCKGTQSQRLIITYPSAPQKKWRLALQQSADKDTASKTLTLRRVGGDDGFKSPMCHQGEYEIVGTSNDGMLRGTIRIVHSDVYDAQFS